jgi:hypothetical protein
MNNKINVLLKLDDIDENYIRNCTFIELQWTLKAKEISLSKNFNRTDQ